MNIRKLLGLKPKVGDKVKGYSDYGVQYEGIVTEIESSNGMPGAYVKGKFIISSLWRGAIEKKDDRFFIPKDLLKHQ